ncbi:MAG: aminoglycoside 2-N-acetyltransferase [Acidimicrobiaceae bacterium]|jgi:aminoglycoside 2'-N-acetyltransferase I
MATPTLRQVATAELTPGERVRLRAMLDVAFEGFLSDEDWDHALGGTHVLVEVEDLVVTHASVVPRRLELPDRALHTGYVEAVATHPLFQRRGYAAAAMQRIGGVIQDNYDIGALSTAIPSFYVKLGWERWRGMTFVNVPEGRLRTEEDDDGVLVMRTPRTGSIDLAAPITCDHRFGDVW